MARNTFRDDPAFLFELRFTLYRKEYGPSLVIIRAWENGMIGPYHTRLDVQMLWNGAEVCKRGQTYCGIPGHRSIDGDAAKEIATSMFCSGEYLRDDEGNVAAGDEELAAWVEQHGETLNLEKETRFGEIGQ